MILAPRLLTMLLAGALAVGTLAAAAVADEDLKTAINPPHLPNTTQYGYSQATVAAAEARSIYVAGQVGMVDAGPNDFESQVDRSFANLIAALEAAGGRAEDIVKITMLIVDHDADKLQYLGKKRRAAFGVNPPASTLIPVTRLYAPGVLFEIDAVAVAPGNR